MNKDILDPQRFLHQIRRTPEVAIGMSRRPGEELTTEQVRARRIAALGNGASAFARRKEKVPGNRLDVNLLDIIATTNDFFEAQNAVDSFRDAYGDIPLRDVDRAEVDAYNANKQTIMDFNHLILDVIDACTVTNQAEPNISFQDLVEFITQQHAMVGGNGYSAKLEEMARTTVHGMRNEFAVEQILIKNGVEYEKDELADAHGGDITVNGVNIDLKASEGWAAVAKAKTAKKGRDPNRIIWSQIRIDTHR